MSPFRRLVLAVLLLSPLSLAACADMPKDTTPKHEDPVSSNDPIEPVNRVVFDVNDFLDRLLFRPLAELYRATIPPPLRDRIADILANMNEPVVFANNLMQGEFTRAGTTIERFGINTTVGLGGSWDWATGWGMQQQQGDFGQTLAVWGAGEGPYLVLPLFGPSNIRDAIGMGVDMVMTPWQYIARIDGQGTEDRLDYISFVAQGIVKREQNIEGLDALKEGSVDFYAQMRSVYHQYRQKQIGGAPDPVMYDEDN